MDAFTDIVFPSQPLSSQQYQSSNLCCVNKEIPLFSTNSCTIKPSRFEFSNDQGSTQPSEKPGFIAIKEVPQQFQYLFSKYPYFNKVQSKVFNDVMYSNNPIILSAPTGSGKTVVFELAIVRELMQNHLNISNLKVVYMAPLKALCAERFRDWKEKFSPCNLSCMEVTGDTDVDDYAVIKKANFIFTTPEKWDSVTRRWKEHYSKVQDISLFLVDEIHMVGDEERGSTIEAVIGRMKCIKEVTKSNLRFIAVSATIPNPEDFGMWLSSENNDSVCFNLDDSYRPVPLKKVVLSFNNCIPSTTFKFDMNLNFKLTNIIAQYSSNKPTLVFCSTRKSTAQAAAHLASQKRFVLSDGPRAQLRERANGIVDARLREVLPCGVGFHHAGLTQQDRLVVEGLFLSGLLPVLCATSTLAMGVNLPAHLVIVKSTLHYAGGAYREYCPADVLQMVGRAGRPQFDTSAVAVIMTQERTRKLYDQLVSGRQVIESSFHRHFTDHLNSEIVLKTLTHVTTATQWMNSLFLHVRIFKNPSGYGLPRDANEEKIKSFLKDAVMGGIRDLRTFNLISYQPDGSISPTEAGTLMARYCVAFKTMKLFGELQGNETLSEVLGVLVKAQEFDDVQLRVSEKAVLNSLNKSKNTAVIRFPFKEKIKTREMKVSVLLQSVLSCLNISDFSLNQESLRLIQIGARLTRCLFEYHSSYPSFQTYINCLLLMKCFNCRLWENTRYVARQFKAVGPVLGSNLANAGFISLVKLVSAEPREVELITNKNSPFGTHLVQQASSLPQYDLFVNQIGEVTERQATLDVVVKPKNKLEPQGNTSTSVVIGTPENMFLFKKRIKDKDLFQDQSFSCKVNVYRSVKEQHVIFWIISHSFVGCDVKSKFIPSFAPDTSLEAEAPRQNTVRPISKSTNIALPVRLPMNHIDKMERKLVSSSNIYASKPESNISNLQAFANNDITSSVYKPVEVKLPRRDSVFLTSANRKRITNEPQPNISSNVKRQKISDDSEYDMALEEMDDSGFIDDVISGNFEVGMDDLLDNSPTCEPGKVEQQQQQHPIPTYSMLPSMEYNAPQINVINDAAAPPPKTNKRLTVPPQAGILQAAGSVNIIGVTEDGQQVRECGHKCADKTSCCHFCCRYGVRVRAPKRTSSSDNMKQRDVAKPNFDIGRFNDNNKLNKPSIFGMPTFQKNSITNANMHFSSVPGSISDITTQSSTGTTDPKSVSTKFSGNLDPENIQYGLFDKAGKISSYASGDIKSLESSAGLKSRYASLMSRDKMKKNTQDTNVSFYVKSLTQNSAFKSIFDDIFD